MHPIVIVILSILICTNASAQQSSSQNSSVVQKHAEFLVTKFQQQLKSELMLGLKKSPITAIAICQARAPQIAAELSTGEVTVGRASDKPRNDLALTPTWVNSLLQQYLNAPQTTLQPIHIVIDNTRIGYVKPIHIQTPCLTCHGEHIAEPLRQKINQSYPNDRAVNYKKGDFRGVFWVETLVQAAEDPAPLFSK